MDSNFKDYYASYQANPNTAQPENNQANQQTATTSQAYAQATTQPPSQATTHAPAQAPSQAPVVVKKRNTALVIVLVINILLLIAILLSISACSTAIGSFSTSLGVSDSISDSTDAPHVGIIYMSGTIQFDGTECSPSGLKTLLDQAASDDSVKAVVLSVDSGGGTATAGEEMAAYVRDFPKPIVVSSGATNASAAYEISSQADSIFVAKTTSIGSIGVAMQVTDLSGLYDMLGINIDTIVSSESKDSTYGNRPLTEQERAWYQGIVDEIEQDFINTVASGRNMSVEDVEALANGLIYTGTQSVQNRLADRVGYIGDAVKAASSLAGFDEGLPSSRLELPTKVGLDYLLDILSEVSNTLKSSIEKTQATTTVDGSKIG